MREKTPPNNCRLLTRWQKRNIRRCIISQIRKFLGDSMSARLAGISNVRARLSQECFASGTSLLPYVLHGAISIKNEALTKPSLNISETAAFVKKAVRLVRNRVPRLNREKEGKERKKRVLDAVERRHGENTRTHCVACASLYYWPRMISGCSE